MGVNRRNFLQQAGLGLFTLGLGGVGQGIAILPVWKRYGQALAETTPRKLALLVGINNYPRTSPLTGCVTDVELQRELLIHRFGFNPKDILTLTDQQATREAIETAFVEHLVGQAQEGDVVVFHFSGYGSQVKVSDSAMGGESLMKSFVPVDETSLMKGKPVANDIVEKTLVLLARSLQTRKVSLVLDTSYLGVGQTLQGNLRVRSCPNPPAEQPSPEELAFQEKLLLRTQPSLAALTGKNRLKQVSGMVLSAAQDGQVATESNWSGFSAGLFTYALTQHLWQTLPASTVYFSLSRAAQTVERLTGEKQQPYLVGGIPSPLATYFLPPQSSQGADGAIIGIEDEGKTAEIHLAGLPVAVLEYYGINSYLTTDLEQRLQVRSRNGLTVKAKLVETNSLEEKLKVGQLVRESVRVIRRNPGLTVALDTSLQRIERVDATSAFANIPTVSAVVNAGEQVADCLFGTIEDPDSLRISKNPETMKDIPSGSYGLFSVGRVLIPNTIGVKNEAVKSAINRLVPKLKTLLAAKLWRLTVNEGSSHLGLEATLEVVDDKTEKLIRRTTLRTSVTPSAGMVKVGTEQEILPAVVVGQRIQYRLRNYRDRDLYIMLVGIDSGGNAVGLYSPETSSETDTSSLPKLKNTIVKAGETLITPAPSTSFNLIVPGPIGLAEIYIIGSRAPFTKTITALAKTPHPKGEGERIVDLMSPLDITQALLQDLHDASGVGSEILGSASDVYAFNVKAWASLSFVYQVI